MGNEPQGRTAGVPGQAVPAMNDIEQALAEALQQHWRFSAGDTWQTKAAAILATEPMQAIARDAAVGRAVLDAVEAEWYNGNMSDGAYERIAAALGQPQETQE